MPLREAVTLMHEQQVGSIVVVDEHKAPLGIFTLRDLRQVVADGSGRPRPSHRAAHDPGAVLSFAPTTAPSTRAIAMTERHIAHVCLVKDQRLCGVVSERDLFSLQRVDLVHLARTIRSAARVEQPGDHCAARSANWSTACSPTAPLRPRSPTSSPCSTTTPCAG